MFYSRFIRSIGYALLLTLVPALQAETDSVSGNHDIWRIDTHSLSFAEPNSENFAKLRYYQRTNNAWVESGSETFFSTQQKDVPLIIFAPGYTSTTSGTIQTGLGLVRLFDKSKKCRVVFWDWYAERIFCRIRSDVRSKIPVAQRSAGYLTLLMQNLKTDSKVCLFGFSFGARIVCGGVQNLNEADAERLHLHVVLSAAATDQNWLGSESRHSNTVKYAEKILVTYNPDDWALAFYPYMYEIGHRAEALGLLGPPMRSVAPQYRSKIEAVNVQHYIGREHQTLKHAGSPVFRSRIGTYFFFE
ncbi:MAG: hypothetical protein LBT89_06965 [Planctomycetaceae bacterium]|jgi:hypothetical protein|nr:hypothetical protein [Planctomycetaceae bacterium]